MEFTGFPKIPRLSRDIVITEKIDGTNASICIGEDGEFLTGSRNRWITPENDNYGFSRWAHENKESLLYLGVGQHFGEWWGKGIQRGYGINEKKFSLFNTFKWKDTPCPSCCLVVPILYEGIFDGIEIQKTLLELNCLGSSVAPGFMKPEGIIIYHTSSRGYFKKTIENDEKPKGGI